MAEIIINQLKYQKKFIFILTVQDLCSVSNYRPLFNLNAIS